MNGNELVAVAQTIHAFIVGGVIEDDFIKFPIQQDVLDVLKQDVQPKPWLLFENMVRFGRMGIERYQRVKDV